MNDLKTEVKLELLKRKVKSDLWNFCLYMDCDFFISRKNELKNEADYISEMYKSGKSFTYILSIPRRTGKSYFANHLIAWLFIQDQNLHIARASYSATISKALNQGLRNILKSGKYKNLINIEFDKDNEEVIHFKNSSRPNILVTSVDGASNGFGFNVIVSDDLYKDYSSALSDTINEKTKNWYTGVFQTSKEGAQQIEIIIGTRWRSDEVADLVEKLETKNIRIHKIKAEQDDGSSFNENVITTDRLQSRKKYMNKYLYNAMYNQITLTALDPVLFYDDFVKIKPELLPEKSEYRLCVIDPADEGTDKLSFLILDVIGENVILREAFATEERWDKTKVKVTEMLKFYKPDKILIENNFNSIEFKNYAISLRDNFNLNAFTFKTTKNKKYKIMVNAPYIQESIIFDVDDKEYNGFVDTICKYDLSNSNQHDDEIDVFAMATEDLLKTKKELNLNIWKGGDFTDYER